MILSRPKVLPRPALCQKRCAACFCFPRKKTFFYVKYFFCTLHYSTAMPESSSVMKITKNHEKSWFLLIFIDFHCFLSKIMKIDGFEPSQRAPTPCTMSETMCGVFLFPKKKVVLMKKYFSALCTLYSYARVELGHENHQKITKNHGFYRFSLIFIKNHEN